MSIMTMSLPANQLSKNGTGHMLLLKHKCKSIGVFIVHIGKHTHLDTEMEEQFSSNQVAVCHYSCQKATRLQRATLTLDAVFQSWIFFSILYYGYYNQHIISFNVHLNFKITLSFFLFPVNLFVNHCFFLYLFPHMCIMVYYGCFRGRQLISLFYPSIVSIISKLQDKSGGSKHQSTFCFFQNNLISILSFHLKDSYLILQYNFSYINTSDIFIRYFFHPD